jgi:type VI secretion system protein ImpK
MTERIENIALIFQDVLTAVVRLRSGRQQSPDAESFRYHMREAVKAAANEALGRGYASEDVRMGTLAVVGFLDESVLSSRDPVFAGWPRQPLQQELFQTHMAGEFFFDNLAQLLARTDSPQLADVLELHALCLLLGFNGRYSGPRSGEREAIRQAVLAKVKRIRGASRELSPSWAAQDAPAAAPPARRSWIWPAIAIACLLAALACFAGFSAALGSGISHLRVLAEGKI